VCFIVPPNPTAIADRIDPHLGMLSIAAVIRQYGYEVNYVEWEEGTMPPPADIYAITAYGVNYRSACRLEKLSKQAAPASVSVLGGPIASALPLRCLEDFDAVCIGEGENAFLEFLRERELGRFYFGTYYPYIDGDSPPPAYDLVDWSQYSRLLMGRRAFGLATSRGCPFDCAFCANDRKWSRFRKQPLETAIRDLQYSKAVTGFDACVFWDNDMELRLSHEFLDALGQEDIIFSYQTRSCSPEWNDAIYEAGGRVAFVGLETGDPVLLNRMNKKRTLREIRESVYKIQEAGISARVGILFGFPGETPTSLKRTRKFVEEMKPDQTFLSFFSPFPGSAVWRDPALYGVTWMAPWDQHRFQGKEGWVNASVETRWMSCEQWNEEAKIMAQWWRELPRRHEADHSWWREE
jgi:radical SAM superfamily enzyme YgiQ (UPF0313 family)